MFSTPLFIEIFAPADSVNHSSGMRIACAISRAARIRRHSGSASAPSSLLGSPSSTTRFIPSGYLSVKLRIVPAMMLAVFWP